MLTSTFIEDIFVEFYILVDRKNIPIHYIDQSACTSFFNSINADKTLTANQAKYILRILQKYKTSIKAAGLDYEDALLLPNWKSAFRIVDLSKKIWIELDEAKTPWVVLKSPFSLKAEFDAKFDNRYYQRWDAERKVKLLELYEFNLIQLYEFVIQHNFEIDPTFLEVISEVEEIWQNQNAILPYSTIFDNRVVIRNSSPETSEWFTTRTIDIVEHDLLLAKRMGYNFVGDAITLSQKIAASTSNSFWLKSSDELINLHRDIQGKMCIILDRGSNTFEWIKQFAIAADVANIDRSSIKVCFRIPDDIEMGFNSWISENGFGGKVDSATILIFNYKPAKWLLNEQENVTLLVTNNLFPSTNYITRDWLSSHPCVIYLGDIKPSELGDQNIVEL